MSNKYNSLKDLLNIDGDDGSFDDEEAQKARERQEEREANAKVLKEKITNLQKSEDEEYKKNMLKILQSEAMDVLMHMKHDIEDSPSARSAEVFAGLVSAVTNSVDTYEKINYNKEKLGLDQQKVLLRADENQGNSLVNGDNNNVIMVGSTPDLIKELTDKGVIDNNPAFNKEIKEVEAEKIEDSEEETEKEEDNNPKEE